MPPTCPVPWREEGSPRGLQSGEALGPGPGRGGRGGAEAGGCVAGVQSWDFSSASTAARACLRDRAASCAVNYTPPMGLLGSRALMCWKAF